MAKIKHFNNFPKMSSITGTIGNTLFELRVRESGDWPLAPWSRPSVNQLRKLLKYAQTGAVVPDRLVGGEDVDIIAFVIWDKDCFPAPAPAPRSAPKGTKTRIARMGIYMSPEGWRFMLHPQTTYNPLGLLQAEQF